MCPDCRELISAALDREDDPARRGEMDAHLAECADCQRWYDDAAAITRLARTAVVPASPGVDLSVLDAAPRPWRARTAQLLRWTLGSLGVAQFLLGVVQIGTLARDTHHHVGQVASVGHLWHESAAWNFAIGAGFVWIATRRGRAAGIAPTLTVFVAVLTLLSLGDLVAGRVNGMWLLHHGVIFAGYGIIVLLTRRAFDFGDPPGHRGHRRWRLWLDDRASGSRRAPVPADSERLRRSPAAEHRRAA